MHPVVVAYTVANHLSRQLPQGHPPVTVRRNRVVVPPVTTFIAGQRVRIPGGWVRVAPLAGKLVVKNGSGQFEIYPISQAKAAARFAAAF